MGRAAGHLRLCRADLLRFFRLHGHRDRLRAAAGIPLSTQLQPALHGNRPAGFLAALAYFSVELAARLLVHPAGWLARRQRPNVRQPYDHNASRRPVARGFVDIRDVGWVTGRVSDRASPVGFGEDARAGKNARDAHMDVGIALADVSCRLRRLGVFSLAGRSTLRSPSSSSLRAAALSQWRVCR